MAGKSKFDWDRIGIEYRANKLSNRELSRKFGPTEGAIRKKAKEKNWQRDLAHLVHARTEELLSHHEVRKDYAHDPVDEAQLVEEIATRSAEVVQGHRRDINESRSLAKLMLAELEAQTRNKDAIADLLEQLADLEEWSPKRRAVVERVTSLQGRVQSLEGLARTMKTLQALERTAFGIDGKETDKDPLDELLEEISDTSRGIDGYDAE